MDHRLACAIALLSPAAEALSQCSWMPGLANPVPPGQPLFTLTKWDPDGAGPLPGCLTTAGSNGNVAYFHDGAWRSVPVGVTPSLWAMGTWNGELVVGGANASYSGTPSFTAAIARWDGTSWRQMGAQSPGSAIDAIREFNGLLYVGGSFTSAGGQSASGLAVWNGTAWSPAPAPPSLRIFALTVHQGQLIAAGANSGGVGGRVSRWTGSSWIDWPVAPPALIEGAADLSGQLYIGGSNQSGVNCWRWDGTAWQPAVTNGSATIGELASHEGSIYSVGSALPRVQRLEGSIWAPLALGLNSQVRAVLRRPDGVYLGGLFVAGSGQPLSRIARFDGSAYHPVGDGVDGVLVYALIEHEGDVLAAGEFTGAGGTPASYIARWDGQAWSAMGAGLNWTVYALAEHNGAVFAGGRFTASGAQSLMGIARWDPAAEAWMPLGSGLYGPGYVHALCSGPDGLYVSGNFDGVIGGPNARNIARWDGDSWHAVGFGIDGDGLAITRFGNDIIVGGTFSLAGGMLAARIARWDGQSYALMGAGFNSFVHALRVHDGKLYAGGLFTSSGGVPLSRMARWDTATNLWTPVEGGVQGDPNTAVYAIESSGQQLLVGGSFAVAGGHPSGNFARLSCSAPCYPNCDDSTIAPLLNVADFTCFLQRFAAGNGYANCDESTQPPMLNVADFTCFLQAFAAGCP